MRHLVLSMGSLPFLCEEVARRAREMELEGRTVTLKLRDDLFRTRTRAGTIPFPTDIAREIAGVARARAQKVTPTDVESQ